MTRKSLIKFLEYRGAANGYQNHACAESVDWVSRTKGTPRQLWNKCPRAEWLLWLIARAGVPFEIYRMALDRSSNWIDKRGKAGGGRGAAGAVRKVVAWEDIEERITHCLDTEAQRWPS